MYHFLLVHQVHYYSLLVHPSFPLTHPWLQSDPPILLCSKDTPILPIFIWSTPLFVCYSCSHSCYTMSSFVKADGSEAQACVPFSVIIVHQPLKSGVTNRVVDSFWGVGGGGGGEKACMYLLFLPSSVYSIACSIIGGGWSGEGVRHTNCTVQPFSIEHCVWGLHCRYGCLVL